MGMLSLMNICWTNLHSPVCDCVAKIYDIESQSYVIPGRGRIPLDEESVLNTLCVPRGCIDVPYKVGHEVEPRLCAGMFPGSERMPSRPLLVTWLGIWKLVMMISSENFLCFW